MKGEVEHSLQPASTYLSLTGLGEQATRALLHFGTEWVVYYISKCVVTVTIIVAGGRSICVEASKKVGVKESSLWCKSRQEITWIWSKLVLLVFNKCVT